MTTAEIELDLDEAEDLEITEFAKIDDAEGLGIDVSEPVSGPKLKISDTSIEDGEDDKEDGEISETENQSDSQQYFSRSSSTRSSRRRMGGSNGINRERSPVVARQYPNPYLEFDHDKIKSRALRFGLTSSSLANSMEVDETPELSEEDLLELYISCGLIEDDGGKLTIEKVSPNHRLDSILIRGTNHMNTNEIFKYLYDLGQKPISMEWVNDAMCVVIFKDKYDAAVSILKTSKPIVMDPRILERKRSIAQSSDNDNNEKGENGEEKSDSTIEDFDYDQVDVVPQSCITVPMPPGYVWRLAAPCEKAKGILVRFATKQDKKQERAERFSEYYKNYGNPNKIGNPNSNREYSGYDRSRRKKFRGETEHHVRKESPSSRTPKLSIDPNDKNGWGQLSAMWDDEEAFQSVARDRLVKRSSKDFEGSTFGISPLKKVDSPKDARDLLQTRSKRKRGSNSSDEEITDDDCNDGDDNILNVHISRKDRSGSFRRNRSGRVDRHADEEDMDWKERLSGPRMRMHADEEEERQKRRAFRRLGPVRGSRGGGEFSMSSNLTWGELNRERGSGNTANFRDISTSHRRPISERLGAKRNFNEPEDEVFSGLNNNNNNNDDGDDDTSNSPLSTGFDLRQKLVNMRRGGGNDEEDDEDDLHDLIFRD